MIITGPLSARRTQYIMIKLAITTTEALVQDVLGYLVWLWKPLETRKIPYITFKKLGY